jgi:hypothetical protein
MAKPAQPDAKEKVLALLAEVDPGSRALALVVCGQSTYSLAEESGLSLKVVRGVLRDAEREGLLFWAAPRKSDREDGHTAMTRLWFRLPSGYRGRLAAKKEAAHA